MPATATASKTETLTAVYLETMHAWDSYHILRCEVRAENAGKEKRDFMAPGAVTRDEINRALAGEFADDGFMDTDDSIVTVKAFGAEEDDFEPGMPYTFYGNWKEYTPKANKWNPKPEVQLQFHARKWRKVKPYDKQGVVKWLKQCPGVKEGIARRLWNAFGPDAIARLKDDPGAVAEEIGGGFTAERAKMAAAHLRENDAMEAAFVDLASLLDGRGMPHTLPKKLVRDYGADAATVVKKNPWPLLKYPRTGIARVDKLFCDLAKAKGESAYRAAISSVKRQTIILQHCLETANNGSTWLTEAAAKAILDGRIAGAEVKFNKAVALGLRAGMVATRWDGDFARWLSAGSMAEDERYIAERTAEVLGATVPGATSKPFRWPDAAKLDVSEHQRAVLLRSLIARWIILGGWPGSGKTYCLARIISAMIPIVGKNNIVACCFTGKAASRLSEVLFEYNIDLRATTIHSLLSGGKASEKDGWQFGHNEDNPLHHRLIVIDEASMLGTGLFATLLRAVSPNAQIIITGDYRQLPPIEHGRPLFDMIQAGVPYAEFQEVRRNSGTGVLACRAIMEGAFDRFKFDDRFQLKPTADDPTSPHNCKIIPTASNAQSVEEIVKFLHMLKTKNIPVNLKQPDGETRPIDVLRDTIVVVATNGIKQGKSELSRAEINKRLQRELNPTGKQLAGSPFRDGDRIICMKNGWMPVVNDESRYYDTNANQPGQADIDESGDKVRVQNGEIGWVIGQEEKMVFARFESPLRVFKIPRGKASESDDGDDDDSKTTTGCSFDLGFAITAHKSQGSQFPIVLFGVDETYGARMVLSMEAVWTILSRFQWFQVIFGKRAVLNGYCKRLALSPRRTFLKEEILEAVERLREERG